MHGTFEQTKARARLVDVRHIVLPDCEVGRAVPRARETISQFLDRSTAFDKPWATRDARRRWQFRLPTICVVNGRPVLRKAWRKTRIRPGDVVLFVSRPGKGAGGSGKQIAGLVALIALTALSGGIASGLLGAELAGTALIGSVTYGQALGAAIVLGGTLAISTLIAPKPAAQPTADPLGQVYSLAAAGNLARLLQPRPVQYGRIKKFPDFASTPFHEYVDNDQYINVLLNLGEGKYFLEALYDSDTVIWTEADGFSDNFSDIQIAQYNPGETVALIPTNVVESSEVTGQELGDPATEPNSGWVGGFAATASGVDATALAIDIAFPAGVFHTNDDGTFTTTTVPLAIEYRPIDAAGAPTGSFTSFPGFPQTTVFGTRQPFRFTFKADVSAGRYEVRMRRTNAPSTTGNTVDTVVWIGLRAFIHGPSRFPCSTLAIRARATNQFSSSRSFGVIATRVLPVWNGSAFVEQATRNPYWAFYDAQVDDDYGAARPPSKVDFQSIVDGAAAAEARGDTFDFEFRSAVQVPQAFDTILGVTRAKHRWSGDVVSSFRDEWQDVPRLMLTDREIVRGSLEGEWNFMPEDSADSVVVQYLDESTWRPAEVQYPPNSESFTAVTPATVRKEGIVNRDQANREAAFIYLQSLYRRIKFTLSTEHDGRLLLLGSTVLLQTELPLEYGQSGRVAGNASGTLTLDPAPSWPSGAHYIRIRTGRGKVFGPILCARGGNDATAILDADDLDQVESDQGMTLADALARPDGAEDASFAIGTADNVPRLCQVLSGRPSGDRVLLNLTVDDERVHSTDIDSPPTIPTLPPTFNPSRPQIDALYATFRQGVIEPLIDAGWQPARGAVSYRAYVSYDGGTSRSLIYEGFQNAFSAVAHRADLRLYVQAIDQNNKPGPFTVVELTVPDIVMADGVVGARSLVNALATRVTTEFTGAFGQVRADLARIAAAAAEADAHALRQFEEHGGNLQEVRTELKQEIATGSASVTTLQRTVLSSEVALAAYQIALDAQLNGIEADVAINASAIVTAEGAIASLGIELGTTNSNVSINATAIDTLEGSVASLTTTTTTLGASVTTVQGAVSTLEDTVDGLGIDLDDLSGTVGGLGDDLGDLDDTVSAIWAVEIDVNGHQSGIYNVGTSDRSDIILVSDNFYWAHPDVNGGDPVLGLAATVIGGETVFLLDGNVYVQSLTAGAVKADNIDVAELSAITADVGRLITGIIADNASDASSHLIIDLANGTITGQA